MMSNPVRVGVTDDGHVVMIFSQSSNTDDDVIIQASPEGALELAEALTKVSGILLGIEPAEETAGDLSIDETNYTASGGSA